MATKDSQTLEALTAFIQKFRQQEEELVRTQEALARIKDELQNWEETKATNHCRHLQNSNEDLEKAGSVLALQESERAHRLVLEASRISQFLRKCAEQLDKANKTIGDLGDLKNCPQDLVEDINKLTDQIKKGGEENDTILKRANELELLIRASLSKKRSGVFEGTDSE